MVVDKLPRKNEHQPFLDGTKYDGGWERGLFHGYGKLEWGTEVLVVASLDISLKDIIGT